MTKSDAAKRKDAQRARYADLGFVQVTHWVHRDDKTKLAAQAQRLMMKRLTEATQ